MAPDDASAATDDLQSLLELQDLDTVISQLVHRKAALPERERLAQAAAAIAGVTAERARQDESRAALDQRQSELERQIATTTDRRRAVEQRLYAARGTPARDLQAMDEEIRHLGERLSELEDAELEIMEQLEPIDSALETLAARRAELDASTATLRAALGTAESEIDQDLALRNKDRDAVAATVSKGLLDRYEHLRRHLGGTGAARLVGNRCSGCHLELPSMEVERARHVAPGTVVTCDQCGRILVPVRAPGAPSASAPQTPNT